MRKLALVVTLLALLSAFALPFSPVRAQDGEQDIVDTAIADGRFTTLVAAVQAAGLVETLKGEGPFTVFAPTDDAFAAVLESLGMSADELLADTDLLTQILLYHVVPGEVLAADVVNLSSATTVEGSDIAISVMDGNVMLNDSAAVIIPDVQASNGVIHVIDSVLLPPSLSMGAGDVAHLRVAHLSPDTPAVEIYVNGDLSDIQALSFGQITGWIQLPAGTYQIAVAPAGTSIDDAAIGPAELTFNADTWTTIAATGSLEAGTLAPQIFTEDYSPLTEGNARVTIFHGIEDAPGVDILAGDGSVLVSNLEFNNAASLEVPAGTYDLKVVPSGATEPVVIDLTGTQLMAETYYFVAAQNTLAEPQVLLEAIDAMRVDELRGLAEMGTIVDVAAGAGSFTTLLAAVEAAGLTETLMGEGPYTVFAPTDEAFAAALTSLGLTADQLLADTDTLTGILLYHVVPGVVTSDQVAGLTSATTVNGANISIQASDAGVSLNNGQANVIQVDIMASNGVIHVIDGVLLPPTE